MSCQNFHLPYRQDKLWGYADQNGKIVVQPKYDSVEVYYNNYRWLVFKNKKVGAIDSLGKEILAIEYDSIERRPLHSTDNDFYLFKNGKIGYANVDGKIIFPCNYAEIVSCHELLFGKVSNFLVKTTPSSLWELKDIANNTIIDNIQEYNDYYDGTYRLKINNQYGLYNVSLRKWIFQPEYDDLAYFEYQDFYRRKKPYENFRFYAKKGKTYWLATREFEIQSFEMNYPDFFENYKSEANIYSAAPPRLNPQPKDLSLLVNKSIRFNSYDDRDLYEFKLIQKGKKYGLELKFKSKGSTLIPTDYDEIKLMEDGEDYYNNQVAFVRKKKKWGILNLKNSTLITPIVYATIENTKIPYLLILNENGKIGLFEIKNNRLEADYNWIKPEYDTFITVDYAQSMDEKYKSYAVYYFKKDGKWCPVGYNGLKFFKN